MSRYTFLEHERAEIRRQVECTTMPRFFVFLQEGSISDLSIVLNPLLFDLFPFVFNHLLFALLELNKLYLLCIFFFNIPHVIKP